MAERCGYLQPLPRQEVERIFARLAVRYGTLLAARYGDLDPLAVQQDWAQELSGHGPDAIDFALDNLPPDRPPTAGQFREICRRAPKPETYRLPAPEPRRRPPPAFMAVRQRVLQAGSRPMSALAEDLRQQELHELAEARAGRPYRRLTLAQKQAWRQALGWPMNWPADAEPVSEEVAR